MNTTNVAIYILILISTASVHASDYIKTVASWLCGNENESKNSLQEIVSHLKVDARNSKKLKGTILNQINAKDAAFLYKQKVISVKRKLSHIKKVKAKQKQRLVEWLKRRHNYRHFFGLDLYFYYRDLSRRTSVDIANALQYGYRQERLNLALLQAPKNLMQEKRILADMQKTEENRLRVIQHARHNKSIKKSKVI